MKRILIITSPFLCESTQYLVNLCQYLRYKKLNYLRCFDKSIISNEPYVIRADRRVEFLKKGTINGKEGVYHMTVQDNVVKHKLFTPKNNWARFSKRWGLPSYDLID